MMFSTTIRKYLLVIIITVGILASLGLVIANTDMARAEHECHHTACDEDCRERQGSGGSYMEEMHREMHGK